MRLRAAGPIRTSTTAVAVLALAASGLAGCATYTDRLAEANLAVAAGNYQSAIGSMNGLLGVGSTDQLPSAWTGDRPLAALERGSLQQSIGSYEGSRRDLSGAEQELELLDLTHDPAGAIAGYIYSDSAKKYRTPPTERLSLNAVNLLNYLAVADLEGAAVEARRFQVMREYLQSQNIDASGPATLGTYLAGFVFEKRGEGDRALRYYEEAMAVGPLDSLLAPVVRLARHNPYRGPRLKETLARATKSSGGNGNGEILIVLGLGRVPHKVPQRIPVGAAIGIAGSVLTQNVDFLKYGATKVVVYPELVWTPSVLGDASVAVDGQAVDVEQLTDLAAAIQQEYDKAKPRIIAAALTRMAARAAVAEGVRAGGKQESQLLGDVLAIVVESAAVALDRPDTRSWTMLPERILVARVPVTPGAHTVDVRFSGASAADRSYSVDIAAGGYSAVVVSEPR
jgi:hypothetical protein